jgi:hypothetical protein
MRSSQQILSVLYNTKPRQVHHHHAEGTGYHLETCIGEVHVCVQVSLQALTVCTLDFLIII